MQRCNHLLKVTELISAEGGFKLKPGGIQRSTLFPGPRLFGLWLLQIHLRSGLEG